MSRTNKRVTTFAMPVRSDCTFEVDPRGSGESTSSIRKKPQGVACIGKENAKKGPTPHLSKFRERKSSDSSLEQPARRLALQEIDPLKRDRISGRRRINSCSDCSVHSRSSIPIYKDNVVAGAYVQDSEKTVKAKYRENFVENAKKNILAALKTSIIPSRTGDIAGRRVASPQDLPHIPQPDVTKIKKEHRKSCTVNKRKLPYEVMSIEIAYNLNYMQEYMQFQVDMNERKKLSSTFLQKTVTADQRRLIVSYLVASTAYYEYPSYILYQAIKIFDRYIDSVAVKTNMLQAIALAALWIALKKDLINDEIPEAPKIINLAPTYFKGDKQLLIDYERKILVSLGFEISFGEPFSMLALYTVLIKEVRELVPEKVQELYYVGSYMIDLSLLMHSLCNLSAVHLAAVCAEIALKLIMLSEERFRSCKWAYWRSRILYVHPLIYNYRLTETNMNHIRKQLLENVIISTDPQSDFHTVYKKYKNKRYGPVSHLLASRVLSL